MLSCPLRPDQVACKACLFGRGRLACLGKLLLTLLVNP
jgi:hypothetical protein